MADRPRGMGRGLAAILAPTERRGEPVPELRRLPVDLIAPNPLQPRKAFDEEALIALVGVGQGARRRAAGARPAQPRRHLRAGRG